MTETFSRRPGRCHLYVPGDRPERFANATRSGADAVIFDLEDSVSPDHKTEARESIGRWLESADGQSGAVGVVSPAVWVRVNSPSGSSGATVEDDLRLAGYHSVRGVCIPKCEHVDELHHVDDLLSTIEGQVGKPKGSVVVAALVESALGFVGLTSIAQSPRVVRLQLGEADLIADLGLDPGPGREELTLYRAAIVAASAAFGLLRPVGPVATNYRDLDALRSSTQVLRRMGFAGRAAIHPAQVLTINQVFGRAGEDLAAARAILAAYDAAGANGAVADGDGQMIDAAVVRGARSTIARAAQLDESAGK